MKKKNKIKWQKDLKTLHLAHWLYISKMCWFFFSNLFIAFVYRVFELGNILNTIPIEMRWGANFFFTFYNLLVFNHTENHINELKIHLSTCKNASKRWKCCFWNFKSTLVLLRILWHVFIAHILRINFILIKKILISSMYAFHEYAFAIIKRAL